MGPTGSDVGRGTAAGYVNMQTKTPASRGHAIGDRHLRQRRSDARDLRHRTSAPLRHDGGWLDKSAVRLNCCGRTAACPAATSRTQEPGNRAVHRPWPRHGNARGRRRADPPSGQRAGLRRPRRRVERRPLTPTTVVAAAPVDQSNYYGSVGYDYDKASREQLHREGRTRRVAGRSRFAISHATTTYRDAIVISIANVATQPATGLVTVSRQGNQRENMITSNQSSASGRFSTGMSNAANGGVEYTHRSGNTRRPSAGSARAIPSTSTRRIRTTQ